MPLPADSYLCSAQPSDIWPIRWLVLSAALDPTQLRWQQFTVVKYQNKVIACGQLRRHGGALELGSLVVKPAWRGHGIGTALTQHLIQKADGPLYLECLGDGRAKFYARFGFMEADWQAMPESIARKFGLSSALSTVLPLPLHIMQYQPQQE